jgi:hypothetical protein
MQDYINEQIKQACKDYQYAFNHIYNMDINSAYQYLIKLKMQYGLCNYFNYNHYILEFISIKRNTLFIYKHWWMTPSCFYYKNEHPRNGLLKRIKFLKTL